MGEKIHFLPCKLTESDINYRNRKCHNIVNANRKLCLFLESYRSKGQGQVGAMSITCPLSYCEFYYIGALIV